MDWLYPKRRGPEWKHGWTSRTVTNMAAPPVHLIAVFGIVVVLLWLSRSTGYEAQAQQTKVNFQVFLLLLPLALMLFMASYSTTWWVDFRSRHARPATSAAPQSRGSPWGLAGFVALLLVLLSYQSAFHSKWFGH